MGAADQPVFVATRPHARFRRAARLGRATVRLPYYGPCSAAAVFERTDVGRAAADAAGEVDPWRVAAQGGVDDG